MNHALALLFWLTYRKSIMYNINIIMQTLNTHALLQLARMVTKHVNPLSPTPITWTYLRSYLATTLT